MANSRIETSALPPKFRTESEESDWWSSAAGIRYAERTVTEAVRQGAFVRPEGRVTQEDLKRLCEASAMLQLKPISIRLAEGDLRDAKVIADAEGTGYQLILKRAVRAGLDAMLRDREARAVQRPVTARRQATRLRPTGS